MAKYSTKDLTTLLKGAGFNDAQIPIMIGICYAESGGVPTKHNTNSSTGDDSYGLWQINMLGNMGPDRRKKFGISSNSELFDPSVNAKAAYVVYKDQGLNAWTTYKNGDYLKHMHDGDNTVSLNPVFGIAGTIAGAVTGKAEDAVGNNFAGISSAIDSVGQNLFKGVASGIGVIVALVLLVLGVVILIMQSNGAKTAVKGTAKIVKAVA